MTQSIDVNKTSHTMDTQGATNELASQASLSNSVKKEPIIKLKAVPVQQQSDQIAEGDGKNPSMKWSPQGKEPEPEYTFDCPFCNLADMTTVQLLDHMKNHSHQPGKCPICAVKGNKDYTSKHLYGHLQLRHRPDSYSSKHPHKFPQA